MGRNANVLRSIVLSSAIALGGTSCGIIKNTKKDVDENLTHGWQYNDKNLNQGVHVPKKRNNKICDREGYNGLMTDGEVINEYAEKENKYVANDTSLTYAEINNYKSKILIKLARELFAKVESELGDGNSDWIALQDRNSKDTVYCIEALKGNKTIKQGANYDFSIVDSKGQKYQARFYKVDDADIIEVQRHDKQYTIKKFTWRKFEIIWKEYGVDLPIEKEPKHFSGGWIIDRDKYLNLLFDINNISQYIKPMPKDTIVKKDTIIETKKLTQEEVNVAEEKMNEIFEYGQKVIFKSNQSEFSNETIKEGLDKLYDMLEKNPSLNIKITGYYGGLNSPLPLERAEKVKKYLVNKGIDTERIQAEGGKEQIAKSIKIEIIK